MFLNILSHFRRNSRRAVGYRTARDEFRVGTPRLEPEAVALRYVFEEQEAERRREERDAVREADRQDPEPAAATRARAASVASRSCRGGVVAASTTALWRGGVTDGIVAWRRQRIVATSRRRCGGVTDGIVAWRRQRIVATSRRRCGGVTDGIVAWRRQRIVATSRRLRDAIAAPSRGLAVPSFDSQARSEGARGRSARQPRRRRDPRCPSGCRGDAAAATPRTLPRAGSCCWCWRPWRRTVAKTRPRPWLRRPRPRGG